MTHPQPDVAPTPMTAKAAPVLIVAPTGRDAVIVAETLASAHLTAEPCPFERLVGRITSESVGAVIIAEEALLAGGADSLTHALRQQPPWSDLPLVVLLSYRRPGSADPALPVGLGLEGLALLLERPLRKSSLISTIKMALRARERQYQVRDHLEEQRRLSAESKRASRSKDEFLAMLAHELRNPLGPIRNATALLEHLAPNDPGIQQVSSMIGRQSAHMARLLDGLLDVSRITRGAIPLDRTALDANSIAHEAIEVARPVIEARGHQLRVVLPTTELWIAGDATRLTQVLGNLLINAAKYTPAGGEITLTVDGNLERVSYRVRDNGIGISAQFLPHVFDLFSQAERGLDRSEGGLGIGLAVVKGIVELHGGWVSASSNGRGNGSEFSVSLPRSEAPVKEIACGSLPTDTTLPPQNILLVDDNRDLAESMASLLRFEGHDVRVAHDGPSALEVAEQFMPAAAVLDIGLPGLNGYDLARALRSKQCGPDLLLIAVTGYGQLEDRQRSEAAGFDCHLVKPFDPQVLSAVISNWALQRNNSRRGDESLPKAI